MSNLKVNMDRPKALIAQMEEKLVQVKNFYEARLTILHANADKFETFVKKFKATELQFGNLYSAGMGSCEHTDEVSMILHGSMLLPKYPVNLELQAKKLDAAAKELFAGTQIRLTFPAYGIEGNLVEFTIYI